ncbi:MAG: transposase [Planctomycetota bacterium]
MTHRIAFRGFDPDGEGRIYEHGILPHWRQDGCSYFVTFRQSDSLPIAVVREMEASRHRWLGQRGVDLSQTDWKQHFATLPATVREEYERFNGSMLENHLDNCHGSCALRDAKNAQVVEAALNHFHETRVQMGDFVIMPNHVHAILRPVEGFELEQILHSIKSFTANKINQLTNRKGEFWQR